MKNYLEKLKQYRCALLIPLYAAIYLPWFFLLEKNVTKHYHVIHMAVDDYIPFCKYFIVPYYIWFIYMGVGIVYCIFTDKEAFYRSFIFMTTGMTLFLIISTVFPNGHHLRPAVVEGNDIFARMVRLIYSSDSSTNLFPSIHVYNSIAGHFAVLHNGRLKNRKWACYGSFILCVLITLSTLFVKQHSMFDVITAFLLSAIMYPIAYKVDYHTVVLLIKKKRVTKKNKDRIKVKAL